ncbi:hypothetical protein DVH24_028534 [Malus domestica]|uniref:Uncharacterized protein n=1 Tax=Malus domestica TaxID=3750 RepID=A0A498IY27_MALDO|nr:hypothetical protein DVH24_028534 [Malus domestica]
MRAKLWLQILNNAINTCHFKNSVIAKIVEENDVLQNDNKDLKKENKKLDKEKKNLEKQKNELKKKSTKKKIRENFQILKAEKISLEELVKKQLEEISELNKTLNFINEVELEKEEKTEKSVHQDSTTNYATESKSIKTRDKIEIVSNQKVDIQSKQILQTLEEVPTESQTLGHKWVMNYK